MSEIPDGTIKARATITLPGARAGDTVYVDPTLPYIRECLNAGWIVVDDPNPVVPVSDQEREATSTAAPTIVNRDEAAW